QLDLSNGRILGRVEKMAAASRYEVKTPQGVAAIKGTKYDISARGKVRVFDGQVAVTTGGNTYTVNAGEMFDPATNRVVPMGPEDRAEEGNVPPIGPGGSPEPILINQPTAIFVSPISGKTADSSESSSSSSNTGHPDGGVAE
ncbi:MAG TPA: FecR domain-containing protein, partial [Verrucomicrobiae bacterium]|nr:FecR domain-containing protein [Verrucomicrobiae bacterium]